MVTEPDEDGVYRPSATLARRGVPESLQKLVGADGQMSGLDKKLLDVAAAANGNISPKDLAAEVGFGLSPAQAASRLRAVLNSRDWLSVENKIQLHMHDLEELKSYIKDKMDEDKSGFVASGDGRGDLKFDIGDPRWSSNLLKVLTAIGAQHEAAFKRLKDAQTKVSEGNAAIMISAIDRAVSFFLFTLAEHYPDMDERVARDIMEDGLERAFSIVDENTLD